MTHPHELISRAPRDRRFSDPGLPVAFGTICGPTRAENQDCVGAVQTGTDFSVVVCDGVAGRPLGREVAEFVTTEVLETLSSVPVKPFARTLFAIERTHRHARSKYRGGPCTTLVCASVTDGRCVVGWVGDSRVYGVRDGGAVEQLTLNDTLQAHVELLRGHPCPDASVALIQAVGVDRTIKANVLEVGPGYRRGVPRRTGVPGRRHAGRRCWSDPRPVRRPGQRDGRRPGPALPGRTDDGAAVPGRARGDPDRVPKQVRVHGRVVVEPGSVRHVGQGPDLLQASHATTENLRTRVTTV